MTDDREYPDDTYLWDGTGEPDPEIVRLEKTLGVLRHQGTVPSLPKRGVAPSGRMTVARPWLAAAAALILVSASAFFAISLRSRTWGVSRVAGAPAVDGRTIGDRGRIGRGEWLETDNASRARVAVGSIGSVEVDPNTRLQLVMTGGREHRMALDRGTIHARIWAPPKFFFVNTQAAVAVDLGCAYSLQVDEQGSGLLKVTHGWVGFERDGRDTYVPEGAVCLTRADKGPGTPRYEDAPSGYGEALMVIDFADPQDPRRAAALDLVLSSARKRDAMTLWHLLTRGTPEERNRVYDRLAALVPPPPDATRAAILAANRSALHSWWDMLGVDTSTWWRFLKKKW